MTALILYFDLGSPYAYLAVERAADAIGREPELEPVLLGAIFAKRGFGSWSSTGARETRIAEIEARAARYGLPPLCWPAGWPPDGLLAMRCATWAKQQGRPREFAQAAFRREFATGADLADPTTLSAAALEAGLDAEEMLSAVRLAPVKDALRGATENAWERGVRGVPSLLAGDTLLYGDDQLELAGRTGP